jgi:hypothetical protein
VKKLVSGVFGLALSVGVAHATTAELDLLPAVHTLGHSTTATGFNPDGGAQQTVSFSFGSLYATGAGTVTYTYLGSEAANTNVFTAFPFEESFINHDVKVLGAHFSSSPVGSSFSQQVSGPGLLNFWFGTIYPKKDLAIVGNALVFGHDASFSVLENYSFKGANYRYALLFNDCGGNGCKKGSDYDFDDMVVGVNFTAPVPEPETYAMMLAGLGMLGTVVRRRRATAK